MAGSPPFTYQVLYRPTGTTQFTAGPTTSSNSVTIPGLTPNTIYDFSVIARNIAGYSQSPVVTSSTTIIPPSPALNVMATQVQSTAVTLSWSQPVTGTQPFSYSINYWISGSSNIQTLTVGQSVLAVTVINLLPNTTYDFEVVSSNINL